MTPKILATLACFAFATTAQAEAVRLSIRSVAPAEFSNMGTEAVAIELDTQSAESFAAFTAERIGKQAFLYLDDQLVLAPRIQSEISGGQLQITAGADGYGGLSQDDFIARLTAAGYLLVDDYER